MSRGRSKRSARTCTDLRPGDEVFGWCAGAFAEYASAPEDQFVKKPANLTFEQAAAVGVSATTALQLLRDDGKVQPGQRVLINGASGGVGTFAVQIAKALGAEVTGVCSTRNVELVRSIGADHVIDYTREDFRQGAERYDLILDNVGDRSMSDTRRALTPDRDADLQRRRTRRRQAGSRDPGVVRVDVRAPAGTTLGQVPEPSRPRRAEGAGRSRQGHAGDRRHVPLGETAEAIAHVAAGHARGTLVIEVSPASTAGVDSTSRLNARLRRRRRPWPDARRRASPGVSAPPVAIAADDPVSPPIHQ